MVSSIVPDWLGDDPGLATTLAWRRHWLADDPGLPTTLAWRRPWLGDDPGLPTTLVRGKLKHRV
ncbi:MAG: hypothetical protein OSA98_09875 [Rubripirellula sp.]|nr:hypothetical protein [Rubripirellula sp.]